jgi:virginiamycin B lyase
LLVTELTVAAPAEGPYGVALGSGGTEEVWTTLIHAGQVARLRNGMVERFDLDAPNCRPSVIVPGPDGAMPGRSGSAPVGTGCGSWRSLRAGRADRRGQEDRGVSAA